jgi:hypothetical protein
MTNFKKQKQSMRKSKKNSKSRSGYNSNIQKGGVSNACMLNASTSGGSLIYNAGANLHNTNPQASLDLDNKYMAYGGPVPLGSNILQGGANKCGDEGVGTSNFKNSTFQQYLNNVNQQLGLNMDGGGFTTDPSEFIAGQPVYKSYDDCCPPAIVGGNLKFGGPDQPVCGFGAVRGGSRKTKKEHSKKYSKKQHSKKQYSKIHGKKNKSNYRKQMGGDWNTVGRSKPAVFSDAFNGPPGVFAYPDDMSKRSFDETQPNYSVNAI